MFTNISWTNYFFSLILVLIIYYIIILLRFFSDDLKNLLSGNRIFNPSISQTRLWGKENAENSIPNEPAESDIFGTKDTLESKDILFSELEILKERLKKTIAETSLRKYIKQEFFLSLQLILKEYSDRINPQIQTIINELIIEECARQGSVMFNEDEVKMLWS